MQSYSELFLCRRKKLDLTCGTKSPEPRFSLYVLHWLRVFEWSRDHF